MPIPLLALFIFSLKWFLKFSLLSKIIPRCLCELVGDKILLLNVRIGSWILDCLLEKIIYLDCLERSGLKDIFQVYAQIDIKFRSPLSVTEALILSFMNENIDVSSAKIFILDWIPLDISLMNIRKRSGPNIEPWGTPANISFQLEV